MRRKTALQQQMVFDRGGNRRGGCVFRCGAGVSAADGILAAAFLFNLWYVLGSWGNVRQYDYYNFVMHTDYFLQNGFFLAAPAAYLQSVYFQPPLWGLVSAAVTKFCMWFGAGREAAFDSVRFVSLFCITGAGIVFWRLLREFKLKDGVRLGLFALFAFSGARDCRQSGQQRCGGLFSDDGDDILRIQMVC